MRYAAGFAAFALAVLTLAASAARAADSKITVVAAENFYGDIARQIGGDRVAVVSIMNNPDQDPHLFETTPGIVRQIADAQVVDLQRRRLRSLDGEAAAPRRRAPAGEVIVAALTCAQKAGRQSASLVRPADHAGGRAGAGRSFRQGRSARTASDYDARLDAFLASLKPLNDKIAAIRGKYAGTAGHRQRAGVRLHGRRARPDNAQRALPALDHERHRAERARRRRLRAGPEGAQGPRDVLQQAGLEQDRAASRRDGARRARSRSSASPRRCRRA